MMPPRTPHGSASIRWAGETLTLLPERAVHWPAAATLFITDPHFGKAATFRSAGIPIPTGSTQQDLARLDALLSETRAQRLVILGDFFHAKAGRSDPVLASLATWRARWPNLEITLVRGNHDQHAGAPPAAWAIQTVLEPFALPPFVCCHHPLSLDALTPDALDPVDGYVLAGHLHPQIVLRGTGRAAMRMPCFWFGEKQALLPAFGSFTGGYTVKPGATDRVFVVGPGRVMEVAPSALRGSK